MREVPIFGLGALWRLVQELAPPAVPFRHPGHRAGGLSGRLARCVMGNRGTPQPRSTLVTVTQEMLSIDTSAFAADVAIPAGFRERR